MSFLLYLCISCIFQVIPSLCTAVQVNAKCENFKKLFGDLPDYKQNTDIKARLGEFPHIAAIGYSKDNSTTIRCGGSLISKKYVILPAHCAVIRERLQLKFVKLGFVETPFKVDSWNPQTDYEVKRVIVHPNYSVKNRTNNIALLELEKEVIFSDNIRPACLSTDSKIDESKLILVEMGRNSEEDGVNVYKSNVTYVSTEECSLQYALKHHSNVAPGQICAINTRSDTCNGNLSGPLQVSSGEIFTLVGIPSHGERCGSNFPAVYTSVNHHLDWLKNIVWS